jgi:hypothetical protein
MVMVALNNVTAISVSVIPMEQMLITAVFVVDINHQLVANVSTSAVRISIPYFRKYCVGF